jgi:hypothetical protein
VGLGKNFEILGLEHNFLNLAFQISVKGSFSDMATLLTALGPSFPSTMPKEVHNTFFPK